MKLIAFDIYPDSFEVDVEDSIMKRVVTYFGKNVEVFGATNVQGSEITVIRLNDCVIGVSNLAVVQDNPTLTSIVLKDSHNREYVHTLTYNFVDNVWKETVEWFFGSPRGIPVVNWNRVWATIEEKAPDFDSYVVDNVKNKVVFVRKTEIPRGERNYDLRP